MALQKCEPVTKRKPRQTKPDGTVSATGTVGTDGVFVPDPPGASIFAPARFTRRPDEAVRSQGRRSRQTSAKAVRMASERAERRTTKRARKAR
jgi:hypothetical protein